jgi:hypothetical protein
MTDYELIVAGAARCSLATPGSSTYQIEHSVE